MAIDPDLEPIIAELRAKDAEFEEGAVYLAEETSRRLNELSSELSNLSSQIVLMEGAAAYRTQQIQQLLLDVAELKQGTPTEPPADPNVLFDSDRDGWDIAVDGTEQGEKLWTAYGPQTVNETYGSGNNSKHRHTPDAVTINADNSLTLSAYKDSSGVYRSGAISTREMTGKGGFFGWNDLPEPKTLRFEATITMPTEYDAIWPAWWLRGAKGAGDHEPDIMEVFAAQTDEWRGSQTLHSTGKINYIKAPWPFVQYSPEPHTWWFEIDPPGTDGYSTFRFGIDDEVTVDAKDQRHPFDLAWGGWDMILQIQIGGNWVGDPDKIYDGKLQNGNTGKPVASWAPDYETFEMTVHNAKVLGK